MTLEYDAASGIASKQPLAQLQRMTAKPAMCKIALSSSLQAA